MASSRNYWTCRKALELCGFSMQKIWGYKMYRYNPTLRYNIISNETNQIVTRDVTVNQIYQFLIKQGVIILDEE